MESITQFQNKSKTWQLSSRIKVMTLGTSHRCWSPSRLALMLFAPIAHWLATHCDVPACGPCYSFHIQHHTPPPPHHHHSHNWVDSRLTVYGKIVPRPQDFRSTLSAKHTEITEIAREKQTTGFSIWSSENYWDSKEKQQDFPYKVLEITDIARKKNQQDFPC